MVKVSVIIPVYNVEKYIEQCVESVLNQTLKEIEIIIVNDGTQDNSIQKIEKYMKDKRIILINKENGGISSARNTGLKIAKGEYVSFIDSDDFIEPHMIEELYNESSGMDIVFSNFVRIDDEKNIEIDEQSFKNLSVNEGIYFYNIKYGYVWNRIYNRNFLLKSNIKFIEGMLLEDLLFSLEVLSLAKKVKYINKNHYFYRIKRKGSIVDNLGRNKELEEKVNKKLVKEIEKFEENFEGRNFIKLRIFLTKLDFYIRNKNMKKEQIKFKKIKMIEGIIEKLWEESFSDEENWILKNDMVSILKGKVFLDINLLKKFYWKNKLINKKYFRRVLAYKIKKYLIKNEN